LADLVSFGLAPALLLYRWALQPSGRIGWLAAFLFAACGALRLARFNVRARSGAGGSDFLGLPIPAAAGLVGSAVWLSQSPEIPLTFKPLPVALAAYLLAFLMVSNLRYRSFKQLQLGRRKPFGLLVSAVLLLLLVAAIPQVAAFLIFSVYVCSGPVEHVLHRWRRAMRPELPPDEEGKEEPAGSPLP
ncbi:MAG: CDP-alcohol phosphatidyltransferase family protein, partial [Nitrospinota bacterium]